MGERLGLLVLLPNCRRNNNHTGGSKIAARDTARKLADREDLVRYLSVLFMPSFQLASDRMDELLVRRNLMELAVAVQHRGPESLESAAVWGGGKVDYRKTEFGFELRYRFPVSGKTELLKVGRD